MKKLFLTIMFFVPMFLMAQEFYYKKGAYLIDGGGDTPYLWQGAYNNFVQGEKEGEAASARMLVYCYLREKGTPRNLDAAQRILDKWGKKDLTVCLAYVRLNIPSITKGDNFVAVNMGAGYHSVNSSWQDYGRKADINKAVAYMKYAKEQLGYNPPSKEDLSAIVEAYCYEHGLCGYKKDLIEAAKHYKEYDDDNMTRYGAEILVKTATSYNRLSEDLKAAGYTWSWMNNYYLTNSEWYRPKMFQLDKVFWTLSDDQRAAEYNAADEVIQGLYNNMLEKRLLDYKTDYKELYSRSKSVEDLNKHDIYESVRDGGILLFTQEDVDAISAIYKKWPETVIPKRCDPFSGYLKGVDVGNSRAKREKVINTEEEGFERVLDVYDMMAKEGLIDTISIKAQLTSKKQSLFKKMDKEFGAQWEEQLANADNERRIYEESRFKDMYRQVNTARKPAKNYHYVPIDDTTFAYSYLNLYYTIERCFDEKHIERYYWGDLTEDQQKKSSFSTYFNLANTAIIYAQVVGFKVDSTNRLVKKPSNSKQIKWFMEKYPKTEYNDYLKELYYKSYREERELEAFEVAYELRSNSSKDDVKEAKEYLSWVSDPMKKAVKAMLNKKFIQEHEQYISQGRDAEFRTIALKRFGIEYVDHPKW